MFWEGSKARPAASQMRRSLPSARAINAPHPSSWTPECCTCWSIPSRIASIPSASTMAAWLSGCSARALRAQLPSSCTPACVGCSSMPATMPLIPPERATAACSSSEHAW
eukprot:128614-Rhodomonas_salina.2